MSDEKSSDEFADVRFEEFKREIAEQTDSIKQKYGDQRGAVEKIIQANGYEPEQLGWVVAMSGASGAPGTGGAPDKIVDAHREVLEAIAGELDVDLKGGE